ncbi:ras GEF [Choiromyces venosus 120613-1]|uniref:Class E vacuolar protein-sorting machinery protein HSE1 n=1 Tax=Choiromyces venosus 120613-1 TaxID=1336337 RepID=A0A3N4J5F4_9PEZI|nr:ras GEF [Choiromyces venosus 120613-1]
MPQRVIRREEIQVPSRMYVRALYNYASEDPTSLSFSQGDVIQVITQLESGWWDGIVHDQRGWFPSNYCALISPDDLAGNGNTQSPLDDSDGMYEDDSYDEYDDDDDDSERDGLASPVLPLEGIDDRADDEAAFWIPQATPDGRLYYFNTITGVTRTELPLETPTSTTESGPRDRLNFSAPEQTRPPPELMARGYEREEPAYHDLGDDDVESASDKEGEMLVLSMHSPSRIFIDRESQATLVDSASTSIDTTRSLNGSFQAGHSHSFSVSTTATAVNLNAASPTINTKSAPTAYHDDGMPVPTSWDELIENTRLAVERYRQAVNTFDRAQYVARAEDVSDMLRLLIAAGSATTDNHSGHPSIIISNKALNPHYRHFMAAFSKLVLSSHVAATDCPPADAESKCLGEADEVMIGVFGFADVARAQRGEKLPRLKPGFVYGSHAGGSWKGVSEAVISPKASGAAALSLAEDPLLPLTPRLIERMEEIFLIVKPALRRLEGTLENTETVVSEYEQEIIGTHVINAAQGAFDAIKRYFNLIDSINMSPLSATPQHPTLVDFSTQKQRLHDSFAELFLACQAVTAPLADEWTAIRGEPLEERLNSVRIFIKEIESGISSLNFSTQLLVEERGEVNKDVRTEDLRKPDTSPIDQSGRTPGPLRHQRTDSHQAPRATPSMDRVIRTGGGGGLKAARVFGEELPQETPWYLDCDYDSDIIYGAKGKVKGGTLVALVERVTRHDMLDSNFISTFLLTYRSFTTASELFNQLVRRFTVQPPSALSSSEFEIWTEKKQKLIRVRVLSILKMWLEQNWMEGLDDNARDLLKKMYQFAKDVMLPQLSGTSQVLSLIETRLRGQEPEMKRLILNMVVQPPPPIMPKHMKKLKFLDIDVLEFARQLTIIESKSYTKLKAAECLSKGWSKQPSSGGPDPAENIRAIIMQSNRLTNWVAEMILTQTEVRKRVIVIKHFIAVAEKCRLLNNFSTLTAILAALQTSSIHRLKRTWEHVPTRTNQTLEGMNTLMGATMNFAEYREMLHIVNPPCVPFLGVYLKDLTFVADGNDDFIKGDQRLINFDKRVKTANIIREIQQYQSVPYPLQPVPELQDYIISNMQSAKDVNDMYNLSLSLEPREREDEKIARYFDFL